MNDTTYTELPGNEPLHLRDSNGDEIYSGDCALANPHDPELPQLYTIVVGVQGDKVALYDRNEDIHIVAPDKITLDK